MAVAVVRGFAVERDLVRFFVVAQNAVVGDIAKEQTAGVAKIDGAFGPARPGPQALNHGVADAERAKAFFVDDFYGGVGVANDIARPVSVDGGVGHFFLSP